MISAWWASVFAGDVYEPHPVHGADLKVHLDGGTLRLSGELESVEDRAALVAQARERIARGIDRVDASRLRVASRTEKPGVLDQDLLSAFPNREAAEYARDFVVKHSRVTLKRNEVVDSKHRDSLRTLGDEGVLPAARRAIDSGKAVLILRVDEVAAHRVRSLLEEETRSEWTVALPPRLAERIP